MQIPRSILGEIVGVQSYELSDAETRKPQPHVIYVLDHRRNLFHRIVMSAGLCNLLSAIDLPLLPNNSCCITPTTS